MRCGIQGYIGRDSESLLFNGMWVWDRIGRYWGYNNKMKESGWRWLGDIEKLLPAFGLCRPCWRRGVENEDPCKDFEDIYLSTSHSVWYLRTELTQGPIDSCFDNELALHQSFL
jgi:hypothetical protein